MAESVTVSVTVSVMKDQQRQQRLHGAVSNPAFN